MEPEILYEAPTVQEYVELRQGAGLSLISAEGAAIGLPNSLFAVSLRQNGELVGMGRVVGDGGCFFHITDIAVRPTHQGKGYGRLLMTEIMKYLEKEMPLGSYATLLADVPADKLYAKFGFRLSRPETEGMYWRKG
ncbi:GNAT family N-acetyltransferase [Paenibacillus sp. P96]|uniref:GNAT family N-acetyltransferase n=1 Tax=Paenibacillus zeirhizosphaerae TaxID=2987519 RepID=A0ABT9FNN1_9BACL|nr:GNAT family N-acetyltransferase [Paenibacillus sp. P96]MDP4095997.1 GNAT family N-acetyltransferase [Paenibacillus sp. P96]